MNTIKDPTLVKYVWRSYTGDPDGTARNGEKTNLVATETTSELVIGLGLPVWDL